MTLLFLTIYLISTHALREEGDRMRWMEVLRSFYFYPRPPRGGRRHSRHRRYVFVLISTHALREEGDNFHPLGSAAMRSIFLPTPSARRATSNSGIQLSDAQFLPTPSARRATRFPDFVPQRVQFLPAPSARRATMPFCVIS